MAASGNGVRKQTLFISIAVSLIAGFLLGIIYSDRPSPPVSQSAQQKQDLPQQGTEQTKQDQLRQVIASLEIAVKQNPDSAEAWTQLGNAYFDTDQPEKAIEAYRNSLAIIPGNPAVLTDLGIMYRHSGQPEKAVESFELAMKVSPRFEQALFNKGIVLYHDLGKTDEALKAWNELLLINPGARGPDGTPLSELVGKLSAFQEQK